MPMTVINVSYPLAPAGPDVVGGAEQVLSRLDRALTAAGHRSIVVARADSTTAGELVPVGCVPAPYDAAALARAESLTRTALERVLQAAHADLVHIHGFDFAQLLPQHAVPVLITLHLPRFYYSTADLQIDRPQTWMHCVSNAQHATFHGACRLLAPIDNGVDLDIRPPTRRRRKFALWLGRICPEKAPHIAMDAARLTDTALLVGGKVYGYPEHVRYFDSEVVPRLDHGRRYIGVASGERKRRLLRNACCLLVTSIVPETSSLVAREALAAGTPVVALHTEALCEAIEQGVTGYLVEGQRELAEALAATAYLDPQRCQEAAREHFSAGRMTSRYLDLYAAIVNHADRAMVEVA